MLINCRIGKEMKGCGSEKRARTSLQRAGGEKRRRKTKIKILIRVYCPAAPSAPSSITLRLEIKTKMNQLAVVGRERCRRCNKAAAAASVASAPPGQQQLVFQETVSGASGQRGALPPWHLHLQHQQVVRSETR